MERKPHSTGNIVGAVVLLVVVLLGLYVGGYFGLGKYENFYPLRFVARDYGSDWLAFTYWPLARLEAAVTGNDVQSGGPAIHYHSRGEVYVLDSHTGAWGPP